MNRLFLVRLISLILPIIFGIESCPAKENSDTGKTTNSKPSKDAFVQYTSEAYASKFIDERRIYLVDLTRSMEGFNGAEDIFNSLKKQLSQTINEMSDTTAEIVFIPFTNHPHEIFKEKIKNKAAINQYINNLQTRRGDTNILEAWNKGIEMLDSTKVNYMFMLTDGVHNSGEPIDSLYSTLKNWHTIAEGKYQFAFYVLLSQAAREQEICDIVESSKQMWLVPSMNINTDFILGKMNLTVNIRNNNRVRLHLTCTNPQIFNKGFRFKISLPQNDFYKIKNASEKLDKNGNLSFEIEKLKTQKDLPISYPTKVLIDYDKTKFPFVFFTPEEYNLDIVNLGTRAMSLKQVIEK